MNSSKFLLLKSLVFVMVLMSFNDTNAQIFPTKIKITVIDRLGNIVEGAKVNLYTSEENYRNSTNASFSGKTDKKGVIKFKKTEATTYYIDARKGKQNNDGQGVQSGELIAGKVNKINVIIE